MTYLIAKDLKRDPEIATALGEMTIAWAYAENFLMVTFSFAAGMDANLAQTAYYRIPTFEARTKLVLAILPESKLPNKEQVSDAVTALAKLASTRNHWVHGVWCREKRTKNYVIFNYRQPIESKTRLKPVKTHDIRHHTATVLDRAGALRALLPHNLIEA